MLRTLGLLAIAVLLATGGAPSRSLAQAPEGYHRLVLYIAEDDEKKMNGVLDVAANVSRHYSAIGEEVEIEIVAYNQGLHMLRADTSPVKERLTNFMQSMINVTFQACGNTLDTMERNEGARPPLLDGTGTVQTGVARLIELDEAGWTLVRP
ncbi:MAG: hypothetical protein RH942_16625 [Kiloniellaceae bacterium]